MLAHLVLNPQWSTDHSKILLAKCFTSQPNAAETKVCQCCVQGSRASRENTNGSGFCGSLLPSGTDTSALLGLRVTKNERSRAAPLKRFPSQRQTPLQQFWFASLLFLFFFFVGSESNFCVTALLLFGPSEGIWRSRNPCARTSPNQQSGSFSPAYIRTGEPARSLLGSLTCTAFVWTCLFGNHRNSFKN